MVVGGWPYYKWYHSFSDEILPHLYVKNVFLAQKLTKLEQFKENLSKFDKEIAQHLNRKFRKYSLVNTQPFHL